MPDRLDLRVADETVMPSMFGGMRLSLKRGAVDLSRVSSASGLSLLADHQGDTPLGIIKRASIRDRTLYATADLIETERSGPFIEDVSAGLKRGVSPGFLIHEAEFVQTDDGELMLEISRWEPFEFSISAIPRNPNAAIVSVDKGGAKAAVPKSTSKAGTGTVVAHTSRPSPASQIASEMADLSSAIAEHQEDSRRWTAAKLEEYAMPDEQRTADPRLVLRAALQADGVVPDEVKGSIVSGHRGQHVVVKLDLGDMRRTAQAAFTSASGDTVGTEGRSDLIGGGGLETSAARILRLPDRLTNLEQDQSVPVSAGEPTSAMLAEGSARLTVVDSTLTASSLSPNLLQTAADFSLTTPLVAPGFEAALIRLMLLSSDRELVRQLLVGDGTAPNLQGVVGATGVLSHEYAAGDKGKLSTFFTSEDLLDVETPSDRRNWILSEDLFRSARQAVIDPGSGSHTVRDGSRIDGDGPPVIRSPLLTAGYGVYGEWSGITLAEWSSATMIVDRITTAGTVKLTLLRYVDFAVTRPARFVTLSAA